MRSAPGDVPRLASRAEHRVGSEFCQVSICIIVDGSNPSRWDSGALINTHSPLISRHNEDVPNPWPVATVDDWSVAGLETQGRHPHDCWWRRPWAV